jgi:hypothetical protein
MSWGGLERRGLARPAMRGGSGWRDFRVISKSQKRDVGQGN